MINILTAKETCENIEKAKELELYERAKRITKLCEYTGEHTYWPDVDNVRPYYHFPEEEVLTILREHGYKVSEQIEEFKKTTYKKVRCGFFWLDEKEIVDKIETIKLKKLTISACCGEEQNDNSK